MEKMIIGIYGRGGQGVITAASILGDAVILENPGEKKYIMIIPTYGPERAGGPVKVFVIINNQPIQDRSSLRKPTHLVIFDKNLLSEAQNDLEDNLKVKSIILNCPQDEQEEIINFYQTVREKNPRAVFLIIKEEAFLVTKEGGANLNIAMLEHFIKETEIVSLETLREAVLSHFGLKY